MQGFTQHWIKKQILMLLDLETWSILKLQSFRKYFAFIDFLADSNLIFSLFHSAFLPKGNKIRISTFEKNKLMRNKCYYKISLWFLWFPFWHCRFCWNKILLVPHILCLNPMAGKIPVFFIIPQDWSQKMALDEVGFCTLILLLQYT